MKCKTRSEYIYIRPAIIQIKIKIVLCCNSIRICKIVVIKNILYLYIPLSTE